MNAVAQLIVVVYNTRKNAYEGARNAFIKVEVTDKGKIKEAILGAFKDQLGEHRGCVLVKYDGKMFLCERDTVNKEKVYTRHEVVYHPLAQHFSI